MAIAFASERFASVITIGEVQGKALEERARGAAALNAESSMSVSKLHQGKERSIAASNAKS
jgi:hypothetical protein